MHLLVGLGNPGTGYAETRHNFGFIALDSIADEAVGKVIGNFSSFSLYKGIFRKHELLMMKPRTYVNLSGNALKEFYQKNFEIDSFMIVYDDLDIEYGKIKLKVGGGDAGTCVRLLLPAVAQGPYPAGCGAGEGGIGTFAYLLLRRRYLALHVYDLAKCKGPHIVLQ